MIIITHIQIRYISISITLQNLFLTFDLNFIIVNLPLSNITTGNMTENNDKKREEIFSRSVRAGKRTYFFDVKATKKGEYYLTVTESKRRFNSEQGKFFYEKFKIFLYKEDFEKFVTTMDETINFIVENNETASDSENISEINNDIDEEKSSLLDDDFITDTLDTIHTDIEFDDL